MSHILFKNIKNYFLEKLLKGDYYSTPVIYYPVLTIVFLIK
jgi:hypothetical protein